MFDIVSLSNINVFKGTFMCKYQLSVLLKKDLLYSKKMPRVERHDGTGIVQTSSGVEVEEWFPKLIFSGNVNTLNKWVEDRGDHLRYMYSIQGVFPMKSSAFYYPFDSHALPLSVTSDWDNSKLELIPDSKTARLRIENLRATLKSEFQLASSATVHATTELGSGDCEYSHLDAYLLVRRKAWSHIFSDIARPLILMILSWASFYTIEDNYARVNFNVSILLAASLALSGIQSAVTVLTMLSIGMFMTIAITTGCAISIQLEVSQDEEFFKIFVGILNGVAVLGFVLVMIFVVYIKTTFGKLLKTLNPGKPIARVMEAVSFRKGDPDA